MDNYKDLNKYKTCVYRITRNSALTSTTRLKFKNRHIALVKLNMSLDDIKKLTRAKRLGYK